MSVTEGEDKPLKHPTIFNGADVAVVTKNELADAVEFDWNAARTAIQAVRPGIQIFRLSAKPAKAWKNAWSFSRRNSRSRKPPSILTKAMERKTATL